MYRGNSVIQQQYKLQVVTWAPECGVDMISKDRYIVMSCSKNGKYQQSFLFVKDKMERDFLHAHFTFLFQFPCCTTKSVLIKMHWCVQIGWQWGDAWASAVTPTASQQWAEGTGRGGNHFWPTHTISTLLQLFASWWGDVRRQHLRCFHLNLLFTYTLCSSLCRLLHQGDSYQIVLNCLNPWANIPNLLLHSNLSLCFSRALLLALAITKMNHVTNTPLGCVWCCAKITAGCVYPVDTL